jgi:uncharacterized protein (TIGR02099 family)
MVARIFYFLWMTFVAVLFLSAVILAAGRLLVPVLGDYRAEIEAHASEVLHKKVAIGRIEGTWRGLNPVLKLQDVAIADPDRPAAVLAIDEVWIGIDVKDYLQHRRVSLKSIDVIGADVTVVRDEDGKFQIARTGSVAGDNGALATLLAIDRLSIHDSAITYEDRYSERHPVRLSDVTFTLDNAGEHPLLIGYVMLPPELGHRIDVAARIYPTDAPPEQWGGRVYVQGYSLSLSRENLLALAPDVNISGTADLRLWANLKERKLRHLRGEVEIGALRLHQQGEDAGTDYSIDRFSCRFGWRKRGSGWQLAAQDLVVAQGQTVREGAGLSVAQRWHGEDAFYSGEFTRLYLEDLQSLVRTAPAIPDEQRHRIARLQPEGLIEKLYIDVRQQGDHHDVLGFEVTFRDLGIRPADGPGFSGLRGTATGMGDSGAIWLRPRPAGFYHNGVFRDAMQFDTLGGEIGWQRQDGGLAISGETLHLENADLAVTGNLALLLPKDAAPAIDLKLDVHRGRLGRVSQYLPARIMSKSGVAWLDRALVSGDIRDGRVVLQGPLDKLPFDHDEGQLLVELPVTGVVLDYNKDWTPIRQLGAQVNFSGRSMDIVSRQGNIRTASLAYVNARIKDLGHPELLLKGSVKGDLPVMLAELGSSPLGEIYGGFVDRVTTTGKTTLGLDLVIPLHGEDPDIGVKGTIDLHGNSLQVDTDDIGLERITGKLAFDADGISGRELQARLLDTPVTVDVWTDPQAAVTNIGIQGALDFVTLVAREQPALAGLLEGKSDWDMQIGIGRLKGRKETPDIRLELASDLKGVAIGLPAPFGKAAVESRPLSVVVDRVAHPEHILQFRYADLLQGVLGIGGGEHGMALQQGNIVIGAKPAVMPRIRELAIDGRLERFALSEWQPVFSQLDGAHGPPVRLDLEIGTLELMQFVLTDVFLRADETGAVQDIRLGGPAVTGTIRRERRETGVDRVTVDLEVLKLRRQMDAPDKRLVAVDPKDFPELDIVIRMFKYEGMKIGKAQLQTGTVAGAVHIKRLAVESDMLSLEATGNWRQEAGNPVSQIDLNIKDGKLEKLFKEFDYQEEVTGGDIHGSLRASWPGTPWAFRPAVLDGKLYLVIKDGQLLNVKPGAGRVFGLVSLHTLPRRLLLDFSDVFKKGYAFDRIEGHFVLTEGDAYTSDLFIDGPAARIDISGRIGLVDEDYDELVTVVPHVSSSLPIAGAIAGGPVVGAAILLAEHLLGDELEKHTKFAHRQYTVTGPWSDPVYTEVDIKPVEPPPEKAKDSGDFEDIE